VAKFARSQRKISLKVAELYMAIEEPTEKLIDVARATAGLNRLWGRVVVDACIRNGLNRFFVAPGSRCTPLTLAIAEHPKAKVTRHYDERGLAFAALGYARACGKPGVFVCTSGTAVANALPAVVEASMEHTPMLLLTADRPPELRGSGANQTIDQANIYGSFVVRFHDLPCPRKEIELDTLVDWIQQGIDATYAGPTHLNCMFREPLTAPNLELPELPKWPRSRYFKTTNLRPSHLDKSVFERRGWFLLGRGTTAPFAIHDTAAACGWPVFGDVMTADHELSLERLLHNDHFAHELAPEVIVHTGERFVSNTLDRYLRERPHIEIYRYPFGPAPKKLYPREKMCDGEFRGVLAWRNGGPEQPLSDHAEVADAIDRNCRAYLDAVLDQSGQLSELAVAREISRRVDYQHPIFLGNSLPIRLLDLAGSWEGGGRVFKFGCNRGASGIDGLVASAAGFASVHGRTTVFIGDISLLHDLNSLPLATNLVLVVLNNDGGGIFHRLPVAEEAEPEVFEDWFGTPHGMHFEAAAQQFGLRYHAPETLTEFTEIFDDEREADGGVIIEVHTDRAQTQREFETVTFNFREVQP